MKKIIYSALVSALLFGSVAAVSYAATSGLIGKKVQGIITVSVNGKAVKDAVVIDGTTYAPVRSFSEAAGYALNIEGGTVKLSNPTQESSEDQIVSELKIKDRIQTLQTMVKQYQLTIDTDNEIITQTQASIDNLTALSKQNDIPFLDLSASKKKVEDAKAEITDLQKKIDAANAEITGLQDQLK
ncbi:hypothetical protein P4H66_19385 [Paenibacillus dokdonensis]|uniref:Copper amine oxidase-like N-terminal domain-containing protein n=1 Tax=Paenibacillus dokdonensis TaxID=2567944 RepID=A0ABU6GQD4_9BACL|nr:hypothetical protein [Paenibacillus dokdonensis]MEC0241969.1 hypothetical protein [Paenibacillus dokdonensis]